MSCQRELQSRNPKSQSEPRGGAGSGAEPFVCHKAGPCPWGSPGRHGDVPGAPGRVSPAEKAGTLDTCGVEAKSTPELSWGLAALRGAGGRMRMRVLPPDPPGSQVRGCGSGCGAGGCPSLRERCGAVSCHGNRWVRGGGKRRVTPSAPQ